MAAPSARRRAPRRAPRAPDRCERAHRGVSHPGRVKEVLSSGMLADERVRATGRATDDVDRRRRLVRCPCDLVLSHRRSRRLLARHRARRPRPRSRAGRMARHHGRHSGARRGAVHRRDRALAARPGLSRRALHRGRRRPEHGRDRRCRAAQRGGRRRARAADGAVGPNTAERMDRQAVGDAAGRRPRGAPRCIAALRAVHRCGRRL